jgi:N-acyl-D-aspartate/D-glutamate deacylase
MKPATTNATRKTSVSMIRLCRPAVGSGSVGVSNAANNKRLDPYSITSSLRSRTKATATAKPSRSWAVTLIKNRGVLLGFVEAPDQKAAELAAAKAFTLSEWPRKWLLVRERI